MSFAHGRSRGTFDGRARYGTDDRPETASRLALDLACHIPSESRSAQVLQPDPAARAFADRAPSAACVRRPEETDRRTTGRRAPSLTTVSSRRTPSTTRACLGCATPERLYRPA